MDTELDADIESLKSLISDEIIMTDYLPVMVDDDDDDCSQNSFDAELNLLATTLKENDMRNEFSNEIEEKCNVQNKINGEIEPNNHITDESSGNSMKPSPLQESYKTSDTSVSKNDVVDGRECRKEYYDGDNCCDTSSGLHTNVTDEMPNDCTVIENKGGTEMCAESIEVDRSQCNVPLKIETFETGNGIGNQKEDCVEHIEKVDKEIVEEDCVDINMADKSNVISVDENQTIYKIHCSTPLVKQLTVNKATINMNSSTSFGLLSPLTTNDGSCCMKRRLCSETLASIKEEEEELIVPLKKAKCDTEDSCNAKNLKTHMKIIEPPAMAILKKWRPKCLSSSSTFYIMDECGDAQSSQSEKEDDDFEIAMKSLSEELIKQSDADDLKTLDLYHSHVLAENEEDGLKFEEILQQMTEELEGMTEFICIDKTEESMHSTDDVAENEITVIEIESKKEKDLSSILVDDSKNNHDSMLVEKKSVENSEKNEKVTSADEPKNNNDDDIIIIKENVKPVENHSEQTPSNNNTEYIALTADEEDVLLEDEPEIILETDAEQKKKPREMVEFISKDPKENEDNFNPEWELLRKLNTDEERYKAVRQRWRSLVIPDPKQDLTFRQWRRRNNLPPSKHLKGNTQATQQQIRKYVGNQLCTALFDQNIDDLLRQKQERRLAMHKELQMKIMNLARLQDQELKMYCYDDPQFSLIFSRHVEEIRHLKYEHQKMLENEERASYAKIEALKKASAEVLAFEKFYQGLDNNKKDDNSVFLSDIEIQELMETEIMLEQYDRYYV